MAQPAQAATVLARGAGIVDLAACTRMLASVMSPVPAMLRTGWIVEPRNGDQERQAGREQCRAQAKGPGAATGHNSSGNRHGEKVPDPRLTHNQAKPDNDVKISLTPPKQLPILT